MSQAFANNYGRDQYVGDHNYYPSEHQRYNYDARVAGMERLMNYLRKRRAGEHNLRDNTGYLNEREQPDSLGPGGNPVSRFLKKLLNVGTFGLLGREKGQPGGGDSAKSGGSGGGNGFMTDREIMNLAFKEGFSAEEVGQVVAAYANARESGGGGRKSLTEKSGESEHPDRDNKYDKRGDMQRHTASAKPGGTSKVTPTVKVNDPVANKATQALQGMSLDPKNPHHIAYADDMANWGREKLPGAEFDALVDGVAERNPTAIRGMKDMMGAFENEQEFAPGRSAFSGQSGLMLPPPQKGAYDARVSPFQY